MPISQTFLAVFVMVLSNVLPKLGVTVGDEALTTTVSVLLTVGAALWALVRRYQAGGVNMVGKRV